MTELTTAETQVLDFVRDWKNSKDGRAMSNAPGVPVSRFNSDELPALRSLLAAGSLKLVEVTKPDKVDPTRDMTYTYVSAV